MLTFHEATGGKDYTGLRNAALRELELTTLMGLGRAILVGRIVEPAAPAAVVRTVSPETPDATKSTFVRFVIPVEHQDRSLPAQLSDPEGEGR